MEAQAIAYDPVAHMKELVKAATATNTHTGANMRKDYVGFPETTQGHLWYYLQGDYRGVFRRCKECRKLEFHLGCYTNGQWTGSGKVFRQQVAEWTRDGRGHQGLNFERDLPWMWALVKDRKDGAPWCKKHPDYNEKTAQWREDKAKRILAKKEARDGKA